MVRYACFFRLLSRCVALCINFTGRCMNYSGNNLSRPEIFRETKNKQTKWYCIPFFWLWGIPSKQKEDNTLVKLRYFWSEFSLTRWAWSERGHLGNLLVPLVGGRTHFTLPFAPILVMLYSCLKSEFTLVRLLFGASHWCLKYCNPTICISYF